MTRTQRLMASVMAALAVTAAAETRPASAADSRRDAGAAPDVTIAQLPAATASPYYGSRGGAAAGSGHVYRTNEERPGCAGRMLRGFGRAFRGGG